MALDWSRFHRGGDGAYSEPRSTLGARDGKHQTVVEPAPWGVPVPFGGGPPVPTFPVDCLPPWQAEWTLAVAEALQVPADLPAVLALAIGGAALATKFRVLIREGWSQPTNLFAVVALLPGERKSAAFEAAIRPVQAFEAEEQVRMGPEIAEAASAHRILEQRVKELEKQAAKADGEEERARLRDEAAQVARDLAAHEVPALPCMFCDDETPEHLANVLAEQGGRILQASAEGTAFEIAKGRYSDGKGSFDTYLKGHEGDPLRTGRMSRKGETVEQPALSVALAVQPDVIRGLAEDSTMKGRGFLARFLYSVPTSRVGWRKTRPIPVPAEVAEAYLANMLELWRLTGATDPDGKPAPHWLRFSRAADNCLESLERWLEPQLAEGEELATLAGWANKLAGAVARIAAILHMAAGSGGDCGREIGLGTVEAAVRIGRDYLLPHAQAAFGLMGADPRIADARRVLAWLERRDESLFVNNAKSAKGCPVYVVSRRDVHREVFGGSVPVEHVDPILALLVEFLYLRPAPAEERQAGPGRHPSARFLVNPRFRAP
jgi:hypothetical protein